MYSKDVIFYTQLLKKFNLIFLNKVMNLKKKKQTIASL